MTNKDVLVEKLSDTIYNEQVAIADAANAWNKKVDDLNGMISDEQAQVLLEEFNAIKRRNNNINRLMDALEKIIKASVEKERVKAFEEFKISLRNIRERELIANEKTS